MLETDDDTKLILVDSRANTNEDKCITNDDSYDHTAEPVGNGTDEYYINAKYILGDDNKVEFILIDVDGRLDGEGTIEIARGLIVDVTDDTAVYAQASDTIGIDVTPLNFVEQTDGYIPGSAAGNKWNGYDRVVLSKVVDENGEDATDSFTMAEINLDGNGDKKSTTISMAGNPDAGEYTATLATKDENPVYASFDFTVAPGKVNSTNMFDVTGSLPETAITAGTKLAGLVTDVETNATIKSWYVSDWKLTANDKDASQVTTEELSAGQTVKLEITVQCTDNYVFENLQVTKELGGVKPIVSPNPNGLTATIVYNMTVGS